MAKWVTQELEGLLQQINEVPFNDDREKRQLTILMNGFAQLNNQAMDRAAEKTRSQLRNWSLEEDIAAEKEAEKDEIAQDSSAHELTKLRPIR